MINHSLFFIETGISTHYSIHSLKMVLPKYKTDKSYYLQAPTVDVNRRILIDDEEAEDELLFQQNAPIMTSSNKSYAKRKVSPHCAASLFILIATFCVVFGLYLIRVTLFKS